MNLTRCLRPTDSFPAEVSRKCPCVLKFVAHSKRVRTIAHDYGWLPGARYTNLRDVRGVQGLGFLDIQWKKYDFKRHLCAAEAHRPFLTIARDIESLEELSDILEEAEKLSRFCPHVVLVPKDLRLAEIMDREIPKRYILGYSVPTRYGGTLIPPHCFTRPTHLLGGRPDIQRALANQMPVVSFDCNRFTLDASFGDYFDGELFRPHPIGGYENCIRDSLKNITLIWNSYEPIGEAKRWLTRMIRNN